MAKKNYDLGIGGLVGAAAGGGGGVGSSVGAAAPAAAPVDWAAVAAAFAPAAPVEAPVVSTDGGGDGRSDNGSAALAAFLDAQYARQEANLRAQLGFKMAQLDQDDANDDTSYQEALRRLQTQQPRDQQAARESANKAGLFYSGTLGKNLGDLDASYAQKSSDMTQARQQRQNQRAAQKQSLASGLDVELGDLAADAAARKLQADTDAADSGYLVRDLGTASTAAQPITVKITPQAQQVKANQTVAKPKKIKPLTGLSLGSLVGKG